MKPKTFDEIVSMAIQSVMPLPDVVIKDGKRKPLKTYCDRMIYNIHQIPFIKSIESHYFASGIRSVVVDKHDNQKYEIVIKPLYEFYEETNEEK